jgi:hypothetical protein
MEPQFFGHADDIVSNIKNARLLCTRETLMRHRMPVLAMSIAFSATKATPPDRVRGLGAAGDAGRSSAPNAFLPPGSGAAAAEACGDIEILINNACDVRDACPRGERGEDGRQPGSTTEDRERMPLAMSGFGQEVRRGRTSCDGRLCPP